MADILIKGMEMPKSCGDCELAKHFDGYNENDCPFNAFSFYDCPLVYVPPHGRLIDADELYEKTVELEAQALHLVGTSDEWRKWSTILAERTAFKYDIADAPTVIEASEVNR